MVCKLALCSVWPSSLARFELVSGSWKLPQLHQGIGELARAFVAGSLCSVRAVHVRR